jgi:enoyl-[acyl-carrier protein] reductase II
MTARPTARGIRRKYSGDRQCGVQLIGQAQGLVRDVPAVADLFERVLAEAAAVRAGLPVA